MAETIYILCALTSSVCAFLLIRRYRENRTRLLLWSSVCFVGLAVNNLLLVVDRVVTGPEIDLSLVRSLTALVAMGSLVIGLIWEVK